MQRVNRGEIWSAQVGGKRRPVLVLTRPEVIDVRELVTVAEVTTTIRGLHSEVPIDGPGAGLPRESAVNCDGLHTVRRSTLDECVGELDGGTMNAVCHAVSYALGC